MCLIILHNTLEKRIPRMVHYNDEWGFKRWAEGGTGKKRVTNCIVGLEFKKVTNVSICTGVWGVEDFWWICFQYPAGFWQKVCFPIKEIIAILNLFWNTVPLVQRSCTWVMFCPSSPLQAAFTGSASPSGHWHPRWKRPFSSQKGGFCFWVSVV